MRGEWTRLFRMRFRDAYTTIFFASWTIFWLALSFRQVWLGYINYGRVPNGRTFTAEVHPVAFYTLLAISVACALFGVFLTFSHTRSAILDARLREEERCAAAKRQADRRNKHRKLRPMTNEQKISLARRARKRLFAKSRPQNDLHKNDYPKALVTVSSCKICPMFRMISRAFETDSLNEYLVPSPYPHNK